MDYPALEKLFNDLSKIIELKLFGDAQPFGSVSGHYLPPPVLHYLSSLQM